jgi:two-component system, sensor histidine kinase and response regulator
MHINILYIDDEKNNLNAFKAQFRSNFNIYIADSAQEGLKILKGTDIHVIITDQRMPGITGVQFFESILHEYPEPVRILLTAYSDIESTIDAINKGQVFRYIRKPWDNHDLKMTIENGYEIYKTKKELLQKNLALQKANDELNRFVYSASHELRSPISTIQGIINVAKTDLKTNPENYLGMIQECVSNMDSLIKNIISYHKNNKLLNEIKEINFKGIISDIIETYRNDTIISSIDLKLDIDQAIQFMGDEFRIRLTMINLLSNAIKYQKQAEKNKFISIKIQTKSDCAILSIEDNGIGIPEEYCANIFKMFYRGTSQNSGTGIGLYIVKEALDKMGGEITLNSTEGIGSIFKVRIPNSTNLVPVPAVD